MPPSGSSATAASGTPASTRWKSGSMAEPAPDRRLGLTMTRVLSAPRERVWREGTEPDAFADWFGGARAGDPPRTGGAGGPPRGGRGGPPVPPGPRRPREGGGGRGRPPGGGRGP